MDRELIAAVGVEVLGVLVILAGIVDQVARAGGVDPAGLIATGSLFIAIGSIWFGKVYRGRAVSEELAGT